MECVEKIRFADDKPKNCKYCYFYGGRDKGCELGGIEQCYYRLPDKKEEPKKSECDGCPYGTVTPCIGYCIKKLMKKGG